MERGRNGLVHVVGPLTKPYLEDLFEEIPGGEVVLDLGRVLRADAEALSLLARLPAGRCRLVDCPKWLSLRMEQELALQVSTV
jgi:hypothetical protein